MVAFTYFVVYVLMFGDRVNFVLQFEMFVGHVFDILSDRQQFPLHRLQVSAIGIQVVSQRLQIVLYGHGLVYLRRFVNGRPHGLHFRSKTSDYLLQPSYRHFVANPVIAGMGHPRMFVPANAIMLFNVHARTEYA